MSERHRKIKIKKLNFIFFPFSMKIRSAERKTDKLKNTGLIYIYFFLNYFILLFFFFFFSKFEKLYFIKGFFLTDVSIIALDHDGWYGFPCRVWLQ